MAPDSRSHTGFRPSRDHDIPNRIPGGFTIGEEIGRGSFAVVYRGVHTPSNQSVAIKAVIKSKLTNKLFQNLQDEIKILKRIRHGNVVGLVDCISDNDYIFLIMQYCSQGDLSVYIKTQSRPNSSHLDHHHASNSPRDKPGPHHLANRFPHPADGGLNEWIVRSFLGQLADALQFLSSNSIIHRDIKPQNLLLHPSSPSPSSEHSQQSSSAAPGYAPKSSPNDHPIGPHRYVPEGIPILRVADFGFARVLAPNAGLAETLCGSPLYMAPEILRYEKYDAKADLWSVGAVLYEMAVGKPPFRAQNHVELLRKIEKSEDRIVFPEEKMVPEDLKRLIRCLLKRNPAERISFTDFFRQANDVSRQGPLVPPAELHRTASLPHSPGPLRPQLPTLHTATGHHTLSRRPPSTSTLPNPPSPKSHRPGSSVAFEGEPGAFIVDKTPVLSREVSSNAIQPSAQAAAGPSFVPTPAQPRRPSHTLTSPTQPSHTHPSHQAPSPSILPAPLPSTHRQPHGMPSFPAKYVILGSPNRMTSTVISTAIKAKDYALMRSPSLKSMAQTAGMKSEEEEDRDLGTEYVVVEKGSVEINALVDALSSSPRKPIGLGRRMSRGFMSSKPTLSALSSSPHRTLLSSSPPPSALVSTPAHAPLHAHPVPGASSFPPRPHPLPSPPTTGIRPVNIATLGRSSPSSQAYYGHYPSSPQSFDSSGGGGGGGIGSLPIVGRYFPQAHSPASVTGSPSAATQPPPRPIFPTSALCRAILSTSDPILRPTNGLGNALGLANNNSTTSRGPSSAAGPMHNLRGPDLVESQLLSELEEVACKVVVIMQFADEKLGRILPARPSAMGASSGPVGGSGSGSGSGPVVGAFVDVKKAGLVGQTHQSGDLAWSAGTRSTAGTSVAAEAMVLYVKALAFLDKGIRHAVAVVERKRAGEGSSSGGGVICGAGICWEVGCAIEWMRTKFNEVFDKAELVRSKVVNDKIFIKSGSSGGGGGGMGVLSVEKLIYDRALEKSRSAASAELLGINLDSCELDYEASMWMFYALLDPVMREDEELCSPSPSPSSSSSSSSEEISEAEVGRRRKKRGGRRGIGMGNRNEVGKESCEKLVRLVVIRLEGLRRKIKSSNR